MDDLKKLSSYLKSISYFSSLNDSEIDLIVSNSIIKKYNENEVIHNPVEKCVSFDVVIKGKLKVAKYSLSGKEQILNYITSGETYGGVLIFSEKNYPAYISAEYDSILLQISKETLYILFSNKKFLACFLDEMSNKILRLSEFIEIISLNSIQKRIALYLLKLAKQSNSKIVRLNKNKTQIAKELGSVREVISRNIKKLQEAGLIKELEGSKIEILDIEKLEDILF